MTSRQRILYKCLKDKISLEDLLNRSISIARFSGTTATSLLNIVMQFRKVCNHPELFERREVDSPLITHPLEIHIPRLLFNYYFQRNNFNDYTEIFYIHSSFNLFFNSDIQNLIFLLNLSVSEWRSLWTFNFLEKWSVLRIISLRLIIFSHWQTWKDKSFIPIHINLFFSPNINSDFDKFIFSGNDSSFLQFIKCTYPYFAAKFVLMCSESKVIANHSFLYASTFRAEVERQLFQSGGCAILKRFFTFGEMTYSSHKNPLKPLFYSSQGIMGIFIPDGWSRICIPAKNKLITDCGKMKLLDSLLFKLKNEGHRVLLYSQMTKMIDLLEEFVAFRRHKYIRFDGSTSIADRRDMVSDFQNNKHIFIFLLSTRAGGLGINLTAADTVIFYDSDWNPTVDQQAMDRAHRLGQMRQVTVYRLVTKGTIDERILERAREKNEIQHMVMEGGNFKIDIMKPKEIASLLIDTDQIDTHLVSNLQENLKQKLNTKDIKRKSKYNLISSKKTKIDTDSHITSLIVPDFHKNL